MSTNTSQYLKYANLQMAAEADLPPGFEGAIPKGLLTEGNHRSSRFTDVLADQFIADQWTVVSHRADSTTGFSGTLFKSEITGELVLSFRSTEFIDDAVRDNQVTNSMEIKQFGWAFGQIADMKDWVQSLHDDGSLFPNARLTVTGYSLGGHLTTAFDLLYPGLATASYTINGAGVGLTTNRVTLADTISQFDAHRSAAADLSGYFSDPVVRAAYQELRPILQGGALLSTAPLSTVALVAVYADRMDPGAVLLFTALTRIKTIQDEVARVSNPPLNSGSALSGPLVPVAARDIEGTDLNYQLAVLLAATNTKPTNANFAIWGRTQGTPSVPNLYDLYGYYFPSAVSNSQLHFGQDTPIYIEDQPLWRGTIIPDFIALSGAYLDAKLLDNDFAKNDFGDTHSLVLLVDSLSVQNALATLDPAIY